MTSIIILQHCYGNTTEILQKYYDCTTGLQTTGYYRPLRVTMINTVTTGFVGKSHGLLMKILKISQGQTELCPSAHVPQNILQKWLFVKFFKTWNSMSNTRDLRSPTLRTWSIMPLPCWAKQTNGHFLKMKSPGKCHQGRWRKGSLSYRRQSKSWSKKVRTWRSSRVQVCDSVRNTFYSASYYSSCFCASLFLLPMFTLSLV